ncbi:hypothetical protein [Dethiothermospora halolimnae]
MTWYLNKETGMKWEVTDEELIKRLSKDKNYEFIKTAKKNSTKSKKTSKK